MSAKMTAGNWLTIIIISLGLISGAYGLAATMFYNRTDGEVLATSVSLRERQDDAAHIKIESRLKGHDVTLDKFNAMLHAQHVNIVKIGERLNVKDLITEP